MCIRDSNALSSQRDEVGKRAEACKALEECQSQVAEREAEMVAASDAHQTKLSEAQSAWDRERYELTDSIKEFRRTSAHYQSKWEKDSAELERVRAELSGASGSKTEMEAELKSLRQEHASMAVALKASRDGTKSLQGQRDAAQHEAAEMGARAATLRAELDSTTALLTELKGEAGELGGLLESSSERIAELQLALEQERSSSSNEIAKLTEAHKQALARLDARCCKLKAESEENRVAVVSANEQAAAASAAAEEKYEELHKQLKFSISEVQQLMSKNEQLQAACTELKLAVWTAQDGPEGAEQAAGQVDTLLLGQARRLQRVYPEELSPPSPKHVPAMGRVSDGLRFNNQNEV
eukprot:TRINITY_DN28890_c0_g1_i1.p1 TRINITY_DN28890_c0_g1~~TRINITY_DN28890_c0_g1_i1.p1  ORF type:complete len:368 (+),score=123.21 TRINITY_DN28890_c0_g1_i1:43-1104(+)